VILVIALGVIGFQSWKIVSALVQAEKAAVVPLPTRNADVALGGAINNDVNPGFTPSANQTPPANTGAVNPTPTEQVIVPADQPTQPVINVTVESVPDATGTAPPTGTVTAVAPAPTATGSSGLSPPTATATASSTATSSAGPTVSPTIETDGTGGPETTPVQAPVATPTVPATATATATGSTTDVAASDSTPASNTAAMNVGEPESDDSPSRMDILRQVLGQGFDSGDPGTSEVWKGRTTINVLVIGLDRRPEGGDQNADVIIIAQIDLLNGKVRGVSIPRDLLVEIPGFGYDKINSAYNHGIAGDPDNSAAGVGLVRDTIEYNFGVPIDDYVLVDFSGFTKVIDAVGGITVDVPYEINDPEYPTDNYGTEHLIIPAGETEMDGELALKYVRTRHADSDDQRRERQLQVLRAIFAKGQSLGSLSKIDNLILALGDSAQTSFPLEEQLTLARLAMQMGDDDITLSSLAPPLIQGGTIASGAWVYSGDMAVIAQFIQDAINGTGDPSAG
jgi:LCP family protein required for cell wall assembly